MASFPLPPAITRCPSGENVTDVKPLSTTPRNNAWRVSVLVSQSSTVPFWLAGLWTLTILDTFVSNEGDDLLSWSITGRVETDQVPEPATLGLFAGALGWFAVRRRQRVATV
jgi:hypothetical protein